MNARKMLYGISVFGMLTAFVVGGSANLYAQNDVAQNQAGQNNPVVANASLSKSQKSEQVLLKSGLDKETRAAKKGKNMEFVNKLITVMSF
jgi:hypothetical protein